MSKSWRSCLQLLLVLAVPGLCTKLHAQGHQTDNNESLASPPSQPPLRGHP